MLKEERIHWTTIIYSHLGWLITSPNRPMSEKKNRSKNEKRWLGHNCQEYIFSVGIKAKWNTVQDIKWGGTKNNRTRHELYWDLSFLSLFNNEILATDGIHHHRWSCRSRPCIHSLFSCFIPFLRNSAWRRTCNIQKSNTKKKDGN